MARALAAAVRPVLKGCIIGSLFGVTFADQCASVVTVDGGSMYPTLDDQQAERALVEKHCLYRYDFSRGDVVLFRSPRNHRELVVKRLIALPGDWIQVPENQEIRQIPVGHCWVEGDNSGNSLDSRFYGPVPLGLMQGKVTHVVWPPHRIGRVDRKLPEGRIMPL
ncbi:Mitochondrial inner membrane protease subunit 2 [Dichanthelium oligosanthes]|uniref:Mitochondrial inner membrane protease subunit 2 n=1 Tax=Dichanthelium oligosanthes TaxID=888268 RepID=A0A1E5VZ73_9POAL|nr:Mitochondrial inner membrane protease subunit 2 [Dichanthelium oligosanthes]